jgi:uncharacterized protein YfaA (DUF2138 family)
VALTRTRKWIVVATLFLLVPAALIAYRKVGWAQFGGSFKPVVIDALHPDVMIRTRSLSALPRDLLRIPLAHDLLTEDFVFYYEDHPDRLGLKGALRRISYEHDLRWSDEILSWVLAQPADALLWRGPKGSLDYWSIAVTRRELAKLLQEAATIAMKDRQLTRAGQITVEGETTDVYALATSSRRTFLVVAHGERVVVLSHPGMLFGDGGVPLGDREALVARLLTGAAANPDVSADLFPPEAAHSVVMRMHYLSFGYQRFFPGFEALRFDFGQQAWSTHALLDRKLLPSAALDDSEIWKAVPANPALCALLPVDWTQGSAIVQSAPEHAGGDPAGLARELEGPAAICWYADGRLQTPLLTATLREGHGDLLPVFEGLFDWTIAQREGQKVPLRPKHPSPDTTLWQRRVEVPYARIDSDGRAAPGPLNVTLASKGRYVFFSPDANLVQQALATAEKRYPSLGEGLAGPSPTLAVLAPKALGEIGAKEALVMLPSADEPVFRAAAERHLLPRLTAIAKYPAYRLALTGPAASAGRSWTPVEWQELAR